MNCLKTAASLTAALATSAALAAQPQPVADDAMINSMNQVGLELLRQTIRTDAKSAGELKNIVVSPLSTFIAFAMLHGGLDGKTHKLYDKFLLLKPDGDANFDALGSELINSLRLTPDNRDADRRGFARKPVVGINNSAWSTSGATDHRRFEFNENFVKSLENNYLAGVHSVDFKSQEAAEAINRWAKDKTNGLIPKVMTPEILRELSWLLLNATYLEANWPVKFQALRGADAPRFTLLNGDKVAPDMLQGKGTWNLVETDRYQAVEIPFYEAGFSFYAIMPRSSRDFIDWNLEGTAFTTEKWNELASAFNRSSEAPDSEDTQVNVRLPKFSFASSEALKRNAPLTSNLGLDFLFDPRNSPDFAKVGGIVGSPPGSYVGIIKQDAKIDLDENGVRAAAVTQIGGIGRTSRHEPRFKKYIVFDKPFVFFIGSRATGALLFAGAVVDPTSH